MRVGEELLHALKAAGAKAAFGLPGDYVLPFFQEMQESGILPFYTLSHEPAVGFAADGAARYGGGVGVAVVTYGAGAMNMVNPVACAWAEHSPLVVISGAPGAGEMKRGLMLHHQIRTPETQMNVFREFTCDQALLEDAAEAPGQIDRVLKNCIRHSRPVYIELPRDMVAAECRHIPHDFSVQDPVPLGVMQECLRDIGERLQLSKRPAFLAGARVRRFGLEESVFSLASDWQVPLLNSFMGKGLFAGKGAPYMGSYLGLAGRDDTRALVEESDLLFLLGVIPCDTNWGVSGRRVDEKNTVMATGEDVTVCGRVYEGLTLRSLVAGLGSLKFSSARKIPKVGRAAARPAAGGVISPDAVVPVLQAFFDGRKERTPLVSDVGDCLFMTMGLEGVAVLASGYYATMGFGVPAALGLLAATGDRPLVLTGDGGFQMTGWELINCVRYGWDPVVVVFNNGSWEMLRQFQPDADYTAIGMADYAALARNMGGEAVRVNRDADLAEALRRAFDRRGKIQLIEVMLPAGVCTSTMRRFAEAIRLNMQKAA